MGAPAMSQSTLLAFKEDVARELGLSKHTARRWLAACRFGPPLRVGKKLAVRRAALDAYIDRLQVEADK